MKVTIIGCGNMGLMFAHALIKDKLVSSDDLLLLEKNEERQNELKALNIGQVVDVDDKRILDSHTFIIAVKPQGFNEMAEELKPLFANAKCLISIMAGVKLDHIASLSGNNNVIRAMPNSPCQLGMGMTGFTASKSLDAETIEQAENLLGSTGKTVAFATEDLIDACTAVSGSGPAYFFYIIQNMVEAGVKMGLDEATAALLAKQTMLGSFHVMENSEHSLEKLIALVSSKGGTTEAAISSFKKSNVGEHIQKGMQKAKAKAIELSS